MDLDYLLNPSESPEPCTPPGVNTGIVEESTPEFEFYASWGNNTSHIESMELHDNGAILPPVPYPPAYYLQEETNGAMETSYSIPTSEYIPTYSPHDLNKYDDTIGGPINGYTPPYLPHDSNMHDDTLGRPTIEFSPHDPNIFDDTLSELRLPLWSPADLQDTLEGVNLTWPSFHEAYLEWQAQLTAEEECVDAQLEEIIKWRDRVMAEAQCADALLKGSQDVQDGRSFDGFPEEGGDQAEQSFPEYMASLDEHTQQDMYR